MFSLNSLHRMCTRGGEKVGEIGNASSLGRQMRLKHRYKNNFLYQMKTIW